MSTSSSFETDHALSPALSTADALRVLTRAVALTSNAMVIADLRQPDLPVVYTNPAFTRMTGYSGEETLGRNCRFLQDADTDQPGVAELRAAIAQRREAKVLLRNYRKSGEPFWNEVTLTPLRDERGEASHYLCVLNDVTERLRHEDQLAHRASHDALTGLPNRQLAFERLTQAIADARQRDHAVAVLFIGLDDLHLVNDTLGHAAGDRALVTLSERLSAVVDADMTVARFGGNDFVVIAPQSPQSPAHTGLLARLTSSLPRPILTEAVRHAIHPSIGYALYPDDGDTTDTLLMHADTAMRDARRQGGGRVVRYEPALNAAVSQRAQLVSRLSEALEQEEFTLAFQPVYAAGGAAVAVEALLRWQHPTRGELLPSEFIGACEDSGLIVELGRRVLLEAARHHALLRQHGHGHLRMAVNVSAAQFAGDLYGHVTDAMGRHGMPAQSLELEITETTVMTSPHRAISTLHHLADLGIGLAIDDFGTGYSSLAYLKRLPISRLKIDRSFVCGLDDDGSDRSICSAIVSMAKALGLHTTAEGVETGAQRRWLQLEGVDEMQGYLMARPLAFDALLARLANPSDSGDATA